MYSWTMDPQGLRFNIGLEHVDQAVAIYEQSLGNANQIILISEDWPWDSDQSAGTRYLRCLD